MKKIHRYVCRDFGRPGCESIPDDRFTMRFDDIGESPIYWCTHCGLEAFKINKAIENAMKTDETFYSKFEFEINKALNQKVGG